MSKSSVMLALLAASQVNAGIFDKLGIIQFGGCPDSPQPVGNFQPEKYSGTWYEIYRDKNIWYEGDNSQCVTASYTYHPDRWLYQVDVKNAHMDWESKEYTDTSLPSWISSVTSGLLGITDTYSWATFDTEGNGHVKFWWYPEGSYQVLDTDYENYSVVYGCDNWPAPWLPIVHTQEAWLLSRKPSSDVETIKNAKKVLKEKVPDYNTEDLWIATTQGDKECRRTSAAEPVPRNSPKQKLASSSATGEPSTPSKAAGVHAYPVTDPVNHVRTSKEALQTVRAKYAPLFKDKITPEQYKIAFEAGTERPFANPYWNNHKDGIYKSIGSDNILFTSRDKFDSGTGWPSFMRPAPLMNGKKSCVVEALDKTHNMSRNEVGCIADGVHLGHVFEDGRANLTDTGLRYCIDSLSMTFIPREELSAEEQEFYFGDLN